MTVEMWGGFLLVVLVLNITPGPDMAYILSRAFAQGTPAGIASAAGVCTGALFHVGLASLIFTIAIHISNTAFAFILIAGGLYLIWLGISALRERPERLKIPKLSDGKAMRRIFFDGVIIDVLNPKVALFFLALLPGFVAEDQTQAGMWFLSLGVLVVLLSFLIESVLVLACQRVRALFSEGESTQLVLHRTMGIVFVLLGGFTLAAVDYGAFL